MFIKIILVGYKLYRYGIFEKCILEVFKRIMVKNGGSLVKFIYYEEKWVNDKFVCVK